jgi:hypothetical protein
MVTGQELANDALKIKIANRLFGRPGRQRNATA